MIVHLSESARATVRACTEAGSSRLRSEVIEPIVAAKLQLPAALASYQRRLEALANALDSADPLAVEHWPSVRAAIELGRRPFAEALEQRARNTHDLAALQTLDASLAELEALRAALSDIEAPSLPRLTDHLTLAAALESRKSLPLRWLPRVRDPVSRILLDSSLFDSDLAFLRDRCALRGLPLALAAMDIDDLRVINSRLGEREVDRRVLPPLLTTLEASVFGHGHAYGFGRDDYALVMPNTDEAEAARSLMRFQAKLATLVYPGLDVRPTLSIGLVVVAPDDARTARELVRDLELAKRHAKDPGGKNCVAAWRTDGPAVVTATHP